MRDVGPGDAAPAVPIGVAGAVIGEGRFNDYEMIHSTTVAQTAQHLAVERFFGVRHGSGGGFQVTRLKGDRFGATPQTTSSSSWSIMTAMLRR